MREELRSSEGEETPPEVQVIIKYLLISYEYM